MPLSVFSLFAALVTPNSYLFCCHLFTTSFDFLWLQLSSRVSAPVDCCLISVPVSWSQCKLTLEARTKKSHSVRLSIFFPLLLSFQLPSFFYLLFHLRSSSPSTPFYSFFLLPPFYYVYHLIIVAAALAAAAIPSSVDISSMTAEEKEKRAKAIRKKLKAVEEVKDKQRSGTKLDAGQVV